MKIMIRISERFLQKSRFFRQKTLFLTDNSENSDSKRGRFVRVRRTKKGTDFALRYLSPSYLPSGKPLYKSIISTIR